MDNKNTRVSVASNAGQGRSAFARALASFDTMRILSPEEIKKYEIKTEVVYMLTNCYGCSYVNAITFIENKTLYELEIIKERLLKGNVKIVNNELVDVETIDAIVQDLNNSFVENKPNKENKKTWKKNKFWE